MISTIFINCLQIIPIFIYLHFDIFPFVLNNNEAVSPLIKKKKNKIIQGPIDINAVSALIFYNGNEMKM
jgi:hypothetical protein